MEKIFEFLSDLSLRLALVIPLAFHGVWNLSADGQTWWKTEARFQSWLSYPVGFIEIACSLAILFKIKDRIASAIVLVIMSGAVMEHLKNGFSFKQNGFETPLIYGLIALSMALRK